MNVEILAFEATDRASQWVCGSCNIIWSDLISARQCCINSTCRLCSRSVEEPSFICRECGAQVQALFRTACKILYVDYEEAYFFWPEANGGGRFFRTRTELEKYCLEQKLVYPRWAWACKETSIHLSANRILAAQYKGIEHYIEGHEVEELQLLLDTWATRQPLKTFEVDYTRAVIIDSALLQREIKDSHSDETLAEV